MWSTLSSSLLKHGKVYWYISLVDSTAFFFAWFCSFNKLILVIIVCPQLQEAVKQRDMALLAVLDGLLEASTTEKLIKCLR